MFLVESTRQRTPSVRGGRAARPLPRTPGASASTSSATSSPSISISSSSGLRPSSASGNTYFPYNGDTSGTSISDSGGRRRLPTTPGGGPVNELKPYTVAGGSIAEGESDDGWASTDGRGTVSRNGSFNSSANVRTPGALPGYDSPPPPPPPSNGKGHDVYSAGVSRAVDNDAPGYDGHSNGTNGSTSSFMHSKRALLTLRFTRLLRRKSQ